MSIADLEYKLKTGSLSLVDCFLVGTLSGIMVYGINHMIEKPKKVDQILIRNLVVGFIFITVIVNWYRGMMWRQRLDMYQRQGFSEKEAKEQALADSRVRGGSSGLVAGSIASRRKK